MPNHDPQSPRLPSGHTSAELVIIARRHRTLWWAWALALGIHLLPCVGITSGPPRLLLNVWTAALLVSAVFVLIAIWRLRILIDDGPLMATFISVVSAVPFISILAAPLACSEAVAILRAEIGPCSIFGMSPARIRAAVGLCPACGYDLRGLPRTQCPECGGTIS